jgi:hypothetical protein
LVFDAAKLGALPFLEFIDNVAAGVFFVPSGIVCRVCRLPVVADQGNLASRFETILDKLKIISR